MQQPTHKLARNAPCWCGSGRKYKDCHLRLDRASRAGGSEDLIPPGVIIKTEEQIQGIRESCHLARDVLNRLTERIQVGVTTGQIDEWVQADITGHGAIAAPLGYKGYPKSTCTSINEVICHGIPSDRALVDGDILNVDVTTILNGYYGDVSRMYLIGHVSELARKLVQVTKECLDLGIAQVKPGNHVGDIGHAIQSHAEANGFSVVRDFVGHGTGVQFHEGFQVPHFGRPGTGALLIPNMVFTIEPMINAGGYQARILEDHWTAITADRSLSAQWEHTVRVTEDGVEVLTA